MIDIISLYLGQGSFNNAKNNWFDDVKKHESEGVVKMLIGTKLDMVFSNVICNVYLKL